MSDVEAAYHRRWLNMAEPVEGLVVSVPVLVDAQCMQRLSAELSQRLASDDSDEGRLTDPLGKEADGRPRRAFVDLSRFFAEVLDLAPELFDVGDAMPKELALYVPEGRETLRATMALRKRGAAAEEGARGEAAGEELPPAAVAGRPYVMLVQEVPGVALDAPGTREGGWAYPPIAKFERLLRACRVPIGLLTNREELRLVYAPHRSIGDVQMLGDLLFSHAAKKTHFHDRRMSGVQLSQTFQRLLQCQQVFAPVQRDHQLIVEFDALPSAGAFVASLAARVVHQNPAHRLGADRQKVDSSLKLHLGLIDQFQECLVNQSGRLQGVTGWLAAQVRIGHRTQLVINHRHQLCGGGVISISERGQTLRGRGIRGWIHERAVGNSAVGKPQDLSPRAEPP